MQNNKTAIFIIPVGFPENKTKKKVLCNLLGVTLEIKSVKRDVFKGKG